MATKIAWTDETWNPVCGCTKVDDTCKNCYAERMACRLVGMGQDKYKNVVENKHWNGKVFCDESALEKPLHWKKPRHVFVPSMGDLFHKDVPDNFIDKVMATIALCPQHMFQVLTKRPERMREYFDGLNQDVAYRGDLLCLDAIEVDELWPLPNLWLGTSVGTQAGLNERLPHLLATPAAHRFLSIEPLIGETNLNGDYFDGKFWGDMLHWVIVGCESGPKRRPCKLEWVESVVDQCEAAGVPVFVKQINIDGHVEHNIEKYPLYLRTRELPKKKAGDK